MSIPCPVGNDRTLTREFVERTLLFQMRGETIVVKHNNYSTAQLGPEEIRCRDFRSDAIHVDAEE
jgi:hypothetical protein